MLLRITKEQRRYILKSEREEYWVKRIEDVEKEIAELKAVPLAERDIDALTEKQEELKAVKESSAQAQTKLTKYGPTVWHIVSVSQKEIDLLMDKLDRPIAKIRGKGKDDITSKQFSYTRTMSREICRKGVQGVDNLRDETGVEIPWKPDLIDILPFDATSELSNQISGAIDEEEAANLS